MSFSIIKKFFSFSIGTWVGAIIGLVTIPIITHFVSPDDLGKAAMFALALNVMMIFTMFGLDQAFVRFYYEEKTPVLLSNCLIITALVFIVELIVFFIFRIKISVYLFDIYIPELMVLLVLAVIVSVINNYAVQIVRMDQKGILYSIIQVSLRLFELIFILVLYFFLKSDYTLLIYAKAITLFVVTGYAMLATKKVWVSLKLYSHDAVYSLKDILIYSYPLAFTMVITWAFQSFDRIALKQWSTGYELGIYVAALRIVLVLQMVQTSFTTYWIPLAYERFLTNDNDVENKAFFSKANGTITAIMLICGVGLVMSKDLVVFILGEEYKDAVSMIPCLVLLPVLFTISESTVIGISFFKKVKTVVIISVLTLLSNIVANYLLVPALKGVGTAIASGISAIVFYSLRTFFSLKYYNVDYKLVKFYLLLLFFSLYALLSTFSNWNIYNLLIGFLLIALISICYFKDIKALANKFFQTERITY